jgi:hypothetical protein
MPYVKHLCPFLCQVDSASLFEMASRRPPTAHRTSSNYTQVRSDDEDEILLPVVRHAKGQSTVLWLIIIVLGLLLAGNAWQQGGLFNAQSALGSYEKGFKTELGMCYNLFGHNGPKVETY